MGQAAPLKPLALIVEDDELQRELVATLLEESDMEVIECESAEAALLVLERIGSGLSMMFTDVNLAGVVDGIALAHAAKRSFPGLHIVVTSGLAQGRKLPDGATFMSKPWLPLDLLREAARAIH